MICYGFKCGSGTASRKVSDAAGGYTVGVFVQANHGGRRELRIGGRAGGPRDRRCSRPAGSLPASRRSSAPSSSSSPPMRRYCRTSSSGSRGGRRWALRARAPRRATARAISFVAFSTANAGARCSREDVAQVTMLSNSQNQRAVQRNRRGHGGGHRQRARRRRDDDRPRRAKRRGAPARPIARLAEEIRKVAESVGLQAG